MSFPSLAGRVALVTGAARGIGRAIAEHLVAEGCAVALCDIDEVTLQGTTDRLRAQGARVGAWRLDVTDRDNFDDVVARVEGELGPIDVLVNNAGIMPVGGFNALAPETDARQIDINLHGVIFGMRAALPRMLRRKRGHIVNIASSAGKVGIPNIAVYCATKHAVVGLTEAVRAEHLDSGLAFTYVMPSIVDTELTSGTQRMRWPPIVTADDVADATIRAIQRGEVDVFVPRAARLAAVLPVLLPRRVTEAVARALKLDRAFIEVDDAARAAYRKRAVGAPIG